MADAAELRIAIVADASKARSELGNVESGVGKLSGAVKGIAAGVVAGFAVDKIVDFGKAAAEAADESAKVSAKTEAIIKATGQAAGITAGQVGDLANALSEKTAVDDEAIQSGANMILTFKNVKNAAGAGADVFNRATAAAVDLSSAGFGSIESASVMLGKSLNDPVKGMTALSKAGVTFSAEQQDTIKTLVASNDLLGAQKIILGEVESQVGGTAAASASAMDRIKLAAGNAMEKIGAAILPVIEKLLPVFLELLDALLPAIIPIVQVLAELAGTVLGALLPALQPLLLIVSQLFQEFGLQLTKALIALLPAVMNLIPPLIEVVKAITPILPIVASLIVALSPLLTLITKLAAFVIELAANIVGPLLKAIEKLLAPLEKLGSLAKGAGGLLDKLNPFAVEAAGGLVLAPAGLGALPHGGTVRQTITINVQSPLGADPYRMGSQIVAALRRYEGRNGPLSAP